MEHSSNNNQYTLDQLVKEKQLDLLPENKEVIDYTKAQKRPQIFAALSAALAAYVIGTAFGWSSSVQPQLQRNTTEAADDVLIANSTVSVWDVKLDVDQISWASSLVNIGALFGSLCGGFLMDKFGRRVALMAMSLPFFIGSLLVTLSVYPGMFYAGRVIFGLAAGVCSAAIPCYIGEISTPNIRGVVGMFLSANLSAGVFFTSLLVWLQWRWISGILTIQPLFLLIAMYLVPESPYFLIKRGRLVEAEKALRWLRGVEYNIAAEMGQIKARVRTDLAQAGRFTDLFQPWAYKPVLIGVTMMIFQQFSGLNAALFYSVEIFMLSGSTLDAAVSAIIVKAVQVMMVVASSIFLVRRLGRRTLFAISEVFTALSLFVLGGFFYILDNDPETAATLGWLPLTSLIVFIASVAIGVAPLPWVVSNEVLPARLRGPGSSVVAFTSWIAAFIVTKTFVDIQRTLTTAGVFWIYGCFCVLGILFSAFIQPETKGKTSDEIQSLFQSK